jgi:crotonobetaine/carnitine-CoA ligase
MRTHPGFAPTLPDREQWTVPEVLRLRARTHAEKVYLDVPSTGERYTFAATLDLAERVASGLLAVGAPGGRVLTMCPNRSEVIFSWLGIALAGMAEMPVNTAYRGSFLVHQVRTVEPTIAIVHAETAELFAAERESCDSIERFFLVGTPAECTEAAAILAAAGWPSARFEELLGAPKIPLPEVSPRDLGAIFFTSGTTGVSKGVMMPHAQIVIFGDQGVALTAVTEDDVYMAVGPLFHGNSRWVAALPALLVGARFVLREKFSASRWVDWLRESGVTVTNLVGVMMDFVWKTEPRADDADNALRCVLAVPTASTILAGFKRRFGIEFISEDYGLTEMSQPILAPFGEERPPGAAGLLLADWYDARLVDPETDREVGVGEVGELVLRPKEPWTTCLGYFNDDAASAKAMRNMWFHTGDGLRRDADGWFYFVDRLNDAIRRRGENISSYEIEQAVAEHDGVSACAAVAVPAEFDAGEDEVMLFVIAEPGVEPAEIFAWCEQRLPKFALPRYVRIMDELPQTQSGKIEKARLRAIGAREIDLVGDPR